MKCRNCDYPLWNLTARKCPECGTPFLPCEYEFVPNSVQFCCPHCNQPYYGTDEKTGHLQPYEFDCVSCGKRISMDECVLRPTEGVKDEQTRPDEMPWQERKQTKKRIRAFFVTIGRGMASPGRLMRSLDDNRSMAWSALWFAVLIQIVVAVLGWGIAFLAIGVSNIFLAPGSGSFWYVGGYLIVAAVFILGWCVFLLVWATVAHVLVTMTGPRRGWYGHTVEAISYSSSPNIITAFPCLGFYLFPVALVWWSITAILALRERQQISGWRASLAVLPLPLLIVAGVVGLLLMGVNASRSYAVTIRPTRQLKAVYSALQDYQYQHPDDSYPQYAAELFRADSVNTVFISGFTASLAVAPESIPVGSGTFADIVDTKLNPDKIQQYIAEAIDDLPDNVIAYRFGEMVITWPGLDPNDTANPSLWLAVIDSPKNTPVKADLLANNPAWQPQDTVFVLREDGTVIPMPTSSIPMQLKKQNELRATLGLPPLPDPGTVTYGSPATALPPPSPKSDDH